MKRPMIVRVGDEKYVLSSHLVHRGSSTINVVWFDGEQYVVENGGTGPYISVPSHILARRPMRSRILSEPETLK